MLFIAVDIIDTLSCCFSLRFRYADTPLMPLLRRFRYADA